MKILRSIAAIICLFGLPALGSGTVQQSGNVTPGHPTMWTTSGVVQDGGSGTNGFLNSMGIFANGGLPDCITASTTPRSTFNLSTSPYTQLCFYAGMGGPAGITLNSYNGATGSGFFFNINGANYPFPGAGGGNVLGPNSSIDGDAATYNGTSGTLLNDAGAPPALMVADIAALAARPVAPLAVNAIVRVGTYSVSRTVKSPPVDYYLTQTTCTPDAGSCIAAATGGYFWHITPQTVWDPRWWGAYGDATEITAAVTTTMGTANVTVTGATFSSADNNKLVTITDYVDSTVGNKPSYQGSILTASGSSLTLASNVGFSTTLSQVVKLGHDDAAAINKMITYIQSLRVVPSNPLTQVASSITGINGGGSVYGVCSAPITLAADAEPENLRLVALCSANMPIAGVNATGLLALTGGPGGSNSGGSYTGSNYVRLDSGYLPVNALYANVNGNTHWNNVVMVNWLGSDAGQAVSVTGSTASPTITVSSTTGLTDGMVSHFNTTACGGGNGIPDRSVIVAISGFNVTLNHTPTGTCTSASVTFYNDASGIVEPANSGLHANDFLQAQLENNTFLTVNANHYGYGLLYEGSQADMTKFITNGGVAPVYVGSSGKGLWILNESILFGGTYSTDENNPPAILIADGGGPTYIDNTGIVGNIQLFYITNTGNPTLRVSHLNYGAGAHVILSPNNVVNLYTDLANTPTFRLIFTPDWDTGSFALGAPGDVSYNTIGPGSWIGISTAQAAEIANSAAYQSAGTTNGPFATQGANLLIGALSEAKQCMIGVVGTGPVTHTYLEKESSCATNVAASGSPITLALPNTLAGDVATGGGGWYQDIAVFTGTTTLTMAGGGTLNGVSAGSIPLQAGTNYHVNCPRNLTGTAAACFATYNSPVPWNCMIPSTTTGAGTLLCFTKFVNASTINNITASVGGTFTTVTATIFECGTSVTCTSPTTIGTTTILAANANKAVPVTVSSAGIAAGDYIAAELTAGTITNVNFSINAEIQQN